MKVFTKLGIVFLLSVFMTGVLWAQHSDAEIAAKMQTLTQVAVDVDINAKTIVYPATDDMFDFQWEAPVGVGGGEAGIETDGNYIYTSKWNGTGEFYRYDIDGTYIEEFSIAGSGGCRDIAYDGTYFYGGAASTTIFQMDFDNATMVSTFTGPAACRAVAYNEDEDVFYCNNWSDNITVFDMTGANLGSWAVGASAASYYGLAYDGYSDGAPFLWGASQTGATGNELIQMSLPDGAETGLTFDAGSALSAFDITGGLGISDGLVSGTYSFLGTCQNVNIWAYELTASGPAAVNDIGIQAIVAPATGPDLTATEAVTVNIKNYGTDPQSGFDVTFTLDGGSEFTETISATINGGETLEHTFANTVDLSAYGIYEFEAWTDLVGDEEPGNDMKTKTVENFAPGYCDASTNTEDEWIIDVICGDINNVGTGWQGGVADYTDQSTTIEAGMGEAITVNNGNAWASDIVYVWVDWNDDFVFEQGGSEEFMLENVGGLGETFTGSIDAPADALEGPHRMRVRMTYSTAPEPCGNASYGEVEDYTITVAGEMAYCDATTTNEDEYITDVICGDINNLGTGWQGGVADYTDQTTSIPAGGSEDIVVNNGNAWSSDIVYAWVDWNMNYVFDQATDEEFILENVGGLGETFTGAIMPPAGTPEGDYRMRVRMTYSTAPLPCDNASYGEVEDYTITVGEGTTPTATCEDFDALTPGDYVALELGGNWTTWSGTPGTAEDGLVSDMYSLSPSNSVLVEGTTDLVHLITGDNITSGMWSYSLNIYVPDGTTGYFNLQKDVVPGTEWGFQVMFEDDMTMIVDGGAAGAAIIPYDYDTWYFCEMIVDLDNDWCEFFVDDNLELGYQWTLGTFGTAGALTLAGSNIYANPGAGGTPPGAHFDDICFEELGGPPPTAECEDFDALTPGDYVAQELGGNWTTWSLTPGTDEDAIVSDMYSLSPSNSIVVEGITDLVHLISGENLTEGKWSYSLNIYVPDGTTGYFNLQKDIVPGTEWGFQVMFEDDMTMVVDGGAAGAAIIPYNYDQWYFCDMHVDLDNDWCEFYVDGNLELEYQWTLGTFGTAGALTLAGSNIYANPGAGGTPPGAYFDDICFEQLENIVWEMPMNVMAMIQNDYDVLVTWDAPAAGTPTGYDVYRNDDFLANVTALEYDDMGLEVGTYEYCVVAVYDGGESLPACADPVTIIDPVPPGPINLTGDDEVTTGNPINLMWEAPGGGEWIHWDAGVNNGNGIGLTDGGTFDCASHWYPSDLGPYNGLSLTTITFFANGDPDATYVLKVWTGANGTTEVHSQDVASFNVDEWNEVALTTPVVISSADDFWFGYEVTHGAGMFPAGTDDGPAVPYNGDMIATGGAWVSMSTDYGLDYNWNIQGWVELADGKGATLTTKLVKPVATSTNFAANGSTGVSSKFVPTANNSKDLESYNVYRSINGGAFTVIGNTPDTEYTDEDVTVSGTYEYEVTAVWDPGGESDPSNVHTVDVLTGIEEMLFNSTLVYPNPASEVVNIKSDFDITSIKVFNHSGQVIADEMVHNKMYQFNTSQYNAGMYFFQIETSEGTISKRIIVQ